jgi:ATP-dependent Clp protease ATP-binding subunit ClpB
MRLDKLTTKFQEALTEAQSLAVTRDNPYIEPAHILLAMLRQEDGPCAMLERAGVKVAPLSAALEKELDKLPQVQGADQVQAGRDTVSLLQGAEKEAHKQGDPYIASEMFLLALCDHKGDTATLARDFGLTRKSLEAAVKAVRGDQKVDNPDAEGQREALKKTPWI